jgi:redox-sensitive bicupin YhaK (pirin superfamily)
MLTLRKSDERFHTLTKRQELWNTFSPRRHSDPLHAGFGALEFLSEYRLPPGAAVPQVLDRDSEVITYVCEGQIALEHSMQAGEFQRMSTTRDLRRKEVNASHSEWAHVFQLWLRAEPAQLAGVEQKRFAVAERRGRLCLIASKDAREGSLRLHRDAQVFSAILAPGQHVVHPIAEGHVAWLHIVSGEGALPEMELSAGDGVGFTGEHALSLTAREDLELLLVDLGDPTLAGVPS